MKNIVSKVFSGSTIFSLVFSLAVPLFSLSPINALAADDCVALGGTLGVECVVNSAISAQGTFNIAETLHITSTGKITIPPLAGGNTLTLNITGDLVMDSGAQIVGDNSSANEKASTIVINATNAVTVAAGASITANKTTGSGAGDIHINAKSITVDGTVESAVLAGLTGQSPHQPKDGGSISLVASCELSVGNTGLVSSRGKDAGADLVHLQAGCNVNVFGRVESTGAGHGIPDSPVNLCNHANRPDKPENSTGCVEIWAGNHLNIDSTNGNKGEINADIGITGGADGRGWIDLFARGDININDGTGNDHTYNFGSCTFNSTFAVHANGGLCQNTDDGGIITVKSRDDMVKAVGHAIQANSTSAGGKGGTITVEAKKDVDLNPDGIFEAMGSDGGAPAAAGGHVNIVSYQGDIKATGSSDLDVTGKSIANPDGTVNLTACGSIQFPPGTITPSNLPLPNIVKTTGGPCNGEPTFEQYVVLPDCVCGEEHSGCQGQVCSGNEVVVDQNVTVDFNPIIPVCNGDTDICNATVFTYSKVGSDPSQWMAIFNLGGDKLLVKSGATIKTAQVNFGSGKATPGITINTTCSLEIEAGGHIVVESLNKQAGNILINAYGDVVVNGEIRDEVKGTLGLPGSIKIETFCGDYTQGTTGQVYVLGIDPGANEIFIFDHDGDVVISGLVLSYAHAHTPPLTANRPKIHVAAFDGDVTINANTVEPLYDESQFPIGGTKFDLWGGLLAWVRDNVNPGTVEVQAKNNVTVNGHGDDPTGPVRKSFGAIAAVATASDAPGGVVKVIALNGNITGNDRAFDVSGRNRFSGGNFAHIYLFANQNITTSRIGGISFNPVVNASGQGVGDKGGINELQAFAGSITNNLGALISAAVPAGSGSVQGTNMLTYCGTLTNNGTIDPAAVTNNTCVAGPTQILFP